MATYAPRPDGLLEVTLDDGRRMPTALDPGTLEAQGIYAQPPMREPLAVPDERLAEANMSQMPESGMSPAPPRAADFPQRPIGPPLPPAPPTDQPLARPRPVTSTAGSPTDFVSEQFGAPPPARPPLVPGQVGGNPGGRPAAPVDDVAAETLQYMRGELAPRGGPARKVDAHFEPVGYSAKFRDVEPNPELDAAIAEGQDDIYAAREQYAEKQEADMGVQARIASRDAAQAQRELERTVVRKNTIENETGRRIQAIEDRFAKARAVTESGSARERVMKDKGWFGRILATIGVAMGAFAAGQTGGRNMVQDQLNKEVDEEFEREKQLYNVEPETSALKAYVDSWGTPEGAQKEYQLQLKNAALTRLDAWARRAGAENVPIEFTNWMADEKQKLLLGKQKLHEDAAAEVTKQVKYVPEKVVGGYSRSDPLKVVEKGARYYKARRAAAGLSDADPKEEERLRQLYVPGEGYAFSEAEAAKLRTGKQSKEELASLTDQALDIRKQYRERKIDLYTAKQQLSSNKGQALAAYKQFKEMGTLDQQTERVFNDIYGEVDSLLSIVAERAGISLGTDRTKALQKNLESDWQKARSNKITTDPYGTTPARPATPGSFQGR